MEGMTCGTSGHGQDCLCDVIVSQETPINRDAVQGLWMGQEVADARGYENWDDPEELLNYLSDVLYLHDKFIEQQEELQGEPEEMVPYSNRTSVNPLRAIRVTVRSAMCVPGARILDVLRKHGYSVEEFTMAASMGHWQMDAHTLQRFEDAILAPNYSYAQVSTEFALTPKGVRKFRRFWPRSQPPTTLRGAGNHPHNIRMRELISQGMRTNDVVTAIKSEFDITITKSAVSQIKKRYGLSTKNS
jgi:hypothetical protein